MTRYRPGLRPGISLFSPVPSESAARRGVLRQGQNRSSYKYRTVPAQEQSPHSPLTNVYNVRVGRSRKLEGPYLDHNGRRLDDMTCPANHVGLKLTTDTAQFLLRNNLLTLPGIQTRAYCRPAFHLMCGLIAKQDIIICLFHLIPLRMYIMSVSDAAENWRALILITSRPRKSHRRDNAAPSPPHARDWRQLR